MGRWYCGVVHSHTNRSDGKYIPADLVKLAEEKGLDFIMITDHNKFCEKIPKSKRVLVIPGTELTTDMGHTNFWGSQRPFDDFDCPDYAEWENKVKTAKERGATVCINHPLCSQCGWKGIPLEPEKADCVEVWNSPQHTDNMRCTAWWQDELRKGKKIPLVGGSDFHRSYVVTAFLDNPVTLVYAEDCTQEAILEAIRAGHTTVSPKAGGQMIEITSGSAIIGDTVKLERETSVTVSVKRLKRGQNLKIIGPSGVIYHHVAVKNGDFSVTVPVKEAGFICAQVEYDLPPVYSQLYGVIERKINHSQNREKLPPYIYSQSGAIYFE